MMSLRKIRSINLRPKGQRRAFEERGISLKGRFIQRGQAAIEYVLLLFVVVSLLTLMMKNVFTPMQKWVQSYMGAYVQCLLEYGELPTLGSEDGLGQISECNAKFEGFTLSGGRSPKGSGGGSGGSNNGKDSEGKGSEDSEQGSKGAKRGQGGAGASRAAQYSQGSSSSSGKGFQRSRGRGALGAETVQSAEVIQISGPGASRQGYQKNNHYSESRGGSGAFLISSGSLSQSEKKILEQKKVEALKNAPMEVQGDVPQKKSKKIFVKTPERKVAMEEKEVDLGFGGFIKILVIVGIIVAILIFVGGQFLQMSKSYKE